MVTAIDGRRMARNIILPLKKEEELRRKSNRQFCLVSAMVGRNTAAYSFLVEQNRVADEIGMTLVAYRRSEDIISPRLFLNVVREFSSNFTVGGVLVNLPLPKQYDDFKEKILDSIDPKKDVGCLNPITKNVLPPAVEVVNNILKEAGWSLEGKKVVVMGAGFLVGSPIVQYFGKLCGVMSVFTSKNAGGSVCESALRAADLVICGTGKPGILKPEMVRPGAGVIDFGFSLKDDKPMGDLDTSSPYISDLAFYTPTPGGTGPVLTACLFENYYKLTKL